MALSNMGPGDDSAAINAKYKGLSSGKNNGRGKREVDQENLEKALIAEKSSIATFSVINSIFDIITKIMNAITKITNLINLFK